MKTPTMIRGALVVLRPAEERDRRAIYEWMALSDLTASMMGPPHYPDAPIPSWEQFRDDYLPYFFDGTKPMLGRSYVIESAGEAVGHVSYSEMDRGYAELDIWLRSEACCGRGFGSDALIALSEHLHQEFGVTEFIMRPSRRNPRAIRAYLKAGFTERPLTQEEQTALYGRGDYDDDTVVLHKRLPAAS